MDKTTFMGYKRPYGRVGIRNHVLVLATVGCAAEAARQTADGIYGAVSFINQNGCGESSRNLRRTQDVLVGMAANPNVYGVVAIGLGCEMNRMDGFIKELRARTDKPIEGLLIQEEGGTIETVAKAKKIARRMVIEASMCRREECDISELMLGIECGGSDATSGLVSNPVMGIISDRIIAVHSVTTPSLSAPCRPLINRANPFLIRFHIRIPYPLPIYMRIIRPDFHKSMTFK